MALLFDDFMGEVGMRAESYDKIDMSELLAAVLFENTQLIGLLGFEDPADNVVYEHIEDYVIPNKIVGGYDYVDGSADEVYFIQASNDHTLAQLLRLDGGDYGARGAILAADDGSFAVRILSVSTAIDWAAGNGYGTVDTGFELVSGTLPTTDTSPITFYVTLPYSDQEDASEDISAGRVHRKGAVRIFERSVEIAETRKHIDLYALSAEDRHQIMLRTIELKNELAGAIIHEYCPAAGGTPTVTGHARRNMTGILQQLNDPDMDGSNETNLHIAGDDTSWATLTADVEEAIQNIYDAGGFDADGADHAIIGNTVMSKFFADITSGDRRAMYDYRKAGYSVNTYHSALGMDLPLITDRFWPTSIMGVLDLNRIKLKQLRGDGWSMEKMGKTGRRDKWQLSGQYGASVKNVQTSHSLITGIAAWPAS